MTLPMINAAVVVALATLLVIEWRWQSHFVRITTLCVAVGILAFAQPNSYSAVRHALDLPAAERRSTWSGGGRPLSEYESGVFTHHDLLTAQTTSTTFVRYAAFGAILWLAMSPTLRTAPQRAHDASGAKEA